MIETRCTKIYECDRLAIGRDAAKAQERADQAREAQAAAGADQGQVGKGRKRKVAPGLVSQGGT